MPEPTDHLKRRYLEHDYARHNLAGPAAEAAHEHARQLEHEHPGLREEALAATAEELGKLPPHLRRHQTRRRRELGITSDRARHIREHGAGHPAPHHEHGGGHTAPHHERAPARSSNAPRPSGKTRPGSPPRRAAPPATPRVVRQAAGKITRAATDTGGWGDTILTTLGWGMGLSIFYLLLTHPAGPSRLAVGAANATRALVAVNVDPLNPTHKL